MSTQNPDAFLLICVMWRPNPRATNLGFTRYSDLARYQPHQPSLAGRVKDMLMIVWFRVGFGLYVAPWIWLTAGNP